MIQFNLLPDIKMEYIRAKRARRNVTLIAFIVCSVSIGIFVLFFVSVNVVQKRHLANLSQDIVDSEQDLKSFGDLDKILTIQNQLNSLTDLHDSKPVVTRFYNYLPQLVPAETPEQNLTLSEASLNFEESTIYFKGAANSLKTINKFIDTLKFTTFSSEGSEQVNAFSNVVLEFSTENGENTFEIKLAFDPLIFDSREKISLKVPKIITTRSETEKPNEGVFKQQENKDQGSDQ